MAGGKHDLHWCFLKPRQHHRLSGRQHHLHRFGSDGYDGSTSDSASVTVENSLPTVTASITANGGAVRPLTFRPVHRMWMTPSAPALSLNGLMLPVHLWAAPIRCSGQFDGCGWRCHHCWPLRQTCRVIQQAILRFTITNSPPVIDGMS